jgi:ABC-type cobalamin/Fe3+-siderophores transport system ATPase subunit
MLKVVQFTAENFKRLIAIDITPNEDLNEITGPNGAGKSSLIDCIPALFGGASEVPGVPIHLGEEKGRIKMSLGDGPDKIEYWISKTFTKKNQKGILKIEDASGNPINESPQSFIDKIRSRISFDPLDLIEKTDKVELKKILFNVLGINLDDMDRKEKDLRQQRESVGRDMKKAEAVYKAIEYYPQVKETEEIKVGDLSAKLSQAMNHNQSIENRKTVNAMLKEEGIKTRNRIEELQEELKKLENDLAITRDRYAKERELIAELEPINIDAINESISTIESTNSKIRSNANRKKAQAEFDIAKSTYDNLTTNIESIANERTALLKNAKWPIPGFSYSEGELLYNSIPLDQVSDGDRLRVGLGIAMAQKPELRVIWTRRGSLIDSRNRAIIKEMIKDKEFQMFFEGVAERGKDGNAPSVGFYIEDGEIAAIDGVEVKNSSAVNAPSLRSPKTSAFKKKVKVDVEPVKSNPAETKPTNDEW